VQKSKQKKEREIEKNMKKKPDQINDMYVVLYKNQGERILIF
jgi:hypothetical protein